MQSFDIAGENCYLSNTVANVVRIGGYLKVSNYFVLCLSRESDVAHIDSVVYKQLNLPTADVCGLVLAGSYQV